MSEPRELDFWTHAGEILDRMRRGGVLCTVGDQAGKNNLLTLGWGQIGPVYHGHPVFYEKIAPPHRLLTPEHRQQPLQKQHTLYFAEVLGAYRGYLDSGAVATPDVR